MTILVGLMLNSIKTNPHKMDLCNFKREHYLSITYEDAAFLVTICRYFLLAILIYRSFIRPLIFFAVC